ncbi:glycosyltransferase family 2 protein [Candidatus Woesearchaeota archaeon]|nr:glycosyltransferase family 2 protein [Candidatus Woesearchaeota archaeon]
MKASVLVGAPVSELHEYCFEEFIDAITSFSYDNYDILLVDNSKADDFFNKIKQKNIPVVKLDYLEKMRDRVTQSHNLLRKEALDKRYDCLLVLDQDIIPPKDVIQKLTSHKKPVVCGLYFGHHTIETGENRIMPFAWKFKEEKRQGHWGAVRYINPDEVWNPQLLEIAFTGMGCVMISREVLEKIKFRYDPSIDAWDDRWLGYDAWANGFKVYLDNTAKCRHLYMKRPFDYHKIKEEGLV